MCLLAIISRSPNQPDAPLVVAANRDELLARPAVSMALLGEAPRVLGGRDLLAGGTWLAVNEHGVVAALTNRPTPGGRDPGKRSRGELPLLLAAHATAAEAARAAEAAIDPAAYNPCWLMVGDRSSLYYLELGAPAPGRSRLRAEELPPGVHVLENRPLGAPSPKADLVRAALRGADAWRGPALLAGLAAVLSSHRLPEGDLAYPGEPGEAALPAIPREVGAACVHAGPYGTRSSAIVVVPADPGLPTVEYADGPPCTSPYRSAAAFW